MKNLFAFASTLALMAAASAVEGNVDHVEASVPNAVVMEGAEANKGSEHTAKTLEEGDKAAMPAEEPKQEDMKAEDHAMKAEEHKDMKAEEPKKEEMKAEEHKDMKAEEHKDMKTEGHHEAPKHEKKTKHSKHKKHHKKHDAYKETPKETPKVENPIVSANPDEQTVEPGKVEMNQ
jgi:hypothetical protein